MLQKFAQKNKAGAQHGSIFHIYIYESTFIFGANINTFKFLLFTFQVHI